MAKQSSFKIGRVTAYLRGNVWYLRYHENGRRRQVRAADAKAAARQLAAQVNAQLEVGAPAATSFEPISIPELRQRWLDHHEHVLRSAVATVNRYRAATAHLLAFVTEVERVPKASNFTPRHAEAFVRHLRSLKVSPNGHKNTTKRKLRDKGIKFILEVCRTLFNYAAKRRHLSPYAENPFAVIEIDRIPIEDAKPVLILTPTEEVQLLGVCDPWQLTIITTLMFTGLRPGELTHLLLPDDLDLDDGWLYVRNKPDLGWQVKTRNERRIPLLPEVCTLLRTMLGDRVNGPVFLRRRFTDDDPLLMGYDRPRLAARLVADVEAVDGDRNAHRTAARRLWAHAGAIRPEKLRDDFIRLTVAIGRSDITAPKSLRHV